MTLITQRLSKPFGHCSYRLFGADNPGTPLILLHGVGLQSAAWHPQALALANCRRVIAVDLPGHGGSAAVPTGSQLPVFLEWMTAVFDALDIGSANLAGHSMGAMIAGGLAVCDPERIVRVALLNGVFRRSENARADVIHRAGVVATGVFDVDTPLDRWFGASAAEQNIRGHVANWLRDVDPKGYATAYDAFARGDAIYADGYQDITCPLLALTGSDDPNSTPVMAQEMARVAPNGRAFIVPGHKHMVNLTAPDVVNTALENWLNIPLTREDAA